ncbi:ornithine carbamoyltransferase [Micromonospora sp. Llam7]|uniref:ornithine carbamoyltransferase n=1 Tax=Micromonospora tarapacensis TaxID=2835305 RepID=UPI001C83BF55|nr:ornithine carbamoyltransferase [Micromonospora tarapacensis]MBX7266522.1 ornithine carbamoyltransferase [Micromonospora tarapacensis]
MANDGSTRHLISLDDLDDGTLRDIVERGAAHARRAGGPASTASSRPAGTPGATLAGTVVGIYFRRTSTRTRTAFTSGALRLGAGVIAYGPGDLQLNTGESSDDTGRVLSGMLDVLVARTADDPTEMRVWARQHRMAVVNAMSADEHPTQALADLTTLTLRFGSVDGLRVLYVGEGNNTASALTRGLSRYPGVHLELRTPPGYGLAPEVHRRAAATAARGAVVRERHDLAELPKDVDVVYTTRWQTTGTSKPDADWREVFAPFQVTAEVMALAPRAVFMHDLPAHRGEEVSAEVLDGPTAIAFDQAENKMYSAMAVLEWCRGTY